MRYKAVIFDYLQYLYNVTGFNDHQVHCVIKFDNRLDAVTLEKSVQLLLKVFPILSRRYINCHGKSYWEDVDPLKWKDLFTVVHNKENFERFTYSKTNEETGPQIKVCLFPSDKDSLSIVMNHMITDGAGFKQCLYLFADIYSNLIMNPSYKPNFVIDGDRSFKKIISEVPTFNKVKTLLLNSNDNNQVSNYMFPMSIVGNASTNVGKISTREDRPFPMKENTSPMKEKTFSREGKTSSRETSPKEGSPGEASPCIYTHSILPARYKEIQSFCHKYNVTMNDVLLTTYFRVLSDMMDINGKTLGIPIMVDMRRYLKDKNLYALSNLTSMTNIDTVVYPNEDFLSTLGRVSSVMRGKKKNNLGLNTFLKLDVIFKTFKKEKAFHLLKNSLKNPNICMTNIGILDSSKLYFKNASITDAFVCGSIKYRPHFQMAVSTFQDKITLSVNLYGNQQDQININKFFQLMDSELNLVHLDTLSYV